MSAFASGVAIVTAMDGDVPRGLTTRSFVAVAAEPPLLLISIDKTSRTLPAIRRSGAYVVNFLAADRQALSDLFASKAEDKFAGVPWQPSALAAGAPVLTEGVVAYAECRVSGEFGAGDHWLVLGTMEGGRFIGGRPLLYYRRSYGGWPG